MTELYVREVMKYIENSIEPRETSFFWAWLGNKKFPEDNGNLTPERARQIIKNLDVLYAEFKGVENG